MKTANKVVIGTTVGLLAFCTLGSLYVQDKYLDNVEDTVAEIKEAADAVVDRAAREKAIEQALQGVPLQNISFEPVAEVTPTTLVEIQGKTVDTNGAWEVNEYGDIEIYRMNEQGDLIRIISTAEGYTLFAVVPTTEPLPMHNCRGIQVLEINGGKIPVQLSQGVNGQCLVAPEPSVSQLITDGLYRGYTINAFGITVTGDAQYAQMLDKITLGI